MAVTVLSLASVMRRLIVRISQTRDVYKRQFQTLPYCDPEQVVAGALRAAKRGRTFYTPKGFYKFYRFVAKLLPMKWMIKAART